MPPGERLVVEMPGGGGYGDPQRRARDKLRRDVLLGFVSEAAAKTGLWRRLRACARPPRVVLPAEGSPPPWR